ncbi:MAG: hypothetical protein MI810_15540 [Flavobacteriales bacterium]|nr:hypothetical protein [Flavobacteriales bacterium]
MLANLSEQARIWIFQADRELNEEEQNRLKAVFEQFIPQWATHGNDLYAAFEFEQPYFLIVGVDEAKMPASGCSIDSMMRVVRDLGDALKVDFTNRLIVAYEDQNAELKLANTETFKSLIKKGEVDENTVVYNNLVQTKAELENGWKTTVANSWHKNMLALV